MRISSKWLKHVFFKKVSYTGSIPVIRIKIFLLKHALNNFVV